jgi:hypothetical protein
MEVNRGPGPAPQPEPTPPPTPPPVAEEDKMVVYIFVHPTINDEGIIWHLKQLSESQNYIEKVVFIESYNERLSTKKGTIEDNLIEIGKTSIDRFIREQYYPPTPENPEQYLPNLNLELDLGGYTDYFENVSILKVNQPYKKRLNSLIKLQKLKIRIKVEKYFLIGKGRISGIGCKRFLSQLLHLKFNPNMLYCAIDGFTVIYEVQYVEDTGKILSPYEVGRNIKGKDYIKKAEGQRPPKKYSDVISEYYEHNTDTFGILKGTDNGKDSKSSESINRVPTVLQKFLILTPVVLNQVFYDPLCTDFKEDVDFFNRLHQFLYARIAHPFYKCTKYFSCKLDSLQSKKGINKYTGVFSPENFKNYRYLYRRFLIDAIKAKDYNILRWYGLFIDDNEGENVVRIIPNVTFQQTSISKVQLELELNKSSEENKLVTFPAKTSKKMILNVAHDNYKKSNEYYPITIFGLHSKKSTTKSMNTNTGEEEATPINTTGATPMNTTGATPISTIASNDKGGKCDFNTYNDKMIKLLLAMVNYFSIVKENNKFQVTGIRKTETKTINLSKLCIDCGNCSQDSRKFKRQKDGNSFTNEWVNSSGIMTPLNSIKIIIDDELIKYLIMICAVNERILYPTEEHSINGNPSKKRKSTRGAIKNKNQTSKKVFIPEENLSKTFTYQKPEPSKKAGKKRKRGMNGGSRKHTKKRQYNKKTKKKIHNKSKNNRTKKTNKRKTHKIKQK